MTDTQPRLTAALADRYVVERELGAGGMATVWLARDLKHARHVALKVLRAELGAVLGSDRFLAEIRTTANLQHPGILGLIDSGEADGLLYYVMPYVDGESLRARLEREGELPIAEAVRIAGELADALEYAHRHGVIHRDIKPENVLLQSGRPLLADFGIALAVQQAGGDRLTQTGLSLGTPQYMSPEQAAADKRVDARSDLYSLGAVTYEMLAGEAPFTAPSTQAVLMKVMTEDARSLHDLRPSVPAGVAEAVHTALAKRPADRFASTKDFAEALEAGFAQRRPDGRSTVALPAARSARRLTPVPLVVAALATVAALWGWLRPRATEVTLPPSTLAMLTPEGVGSAAGAARGLAISPDGERVLYLGQGTVGSTHIVVQRLDRLEPTVLPGTEYAFYASFAPDGNTVIFGSYSGGEAMRATLDGGKPTRMRGVSATPHTAWAPDGTLWFSDFTTGRLMHLLPDGNVVPLKAEGRSALLIQSILPDGQRALVIDATTRGGEGTLAVLELRTGRREPLLNHPVVEARYAVGFLVFARGDGALIAVPFDADAARVTGEEVQIGENVSLSGSGIAQFAVAQNGTVVYLPQQPRQLMLVNRRGEATPLLAERRSFHSPRFSPDGGRIAMDFATADGRDIWTLDRAQGTLTRVTSVQDGHDASWLPDGRSLLYTSLASGTFGVYRLRPGGGVDTVVQDERVSWTGELLPDGRTLVTQATMDPARPSGDIVQVDSAGRVTPLVASTFDEGWPAVSPDGRWLAFVSALSGQSEVYVRAISGESELVQVSLRGGSEPVWSSDGRELFYRATLQGHSELMVAAVVPGTTFAVRSRTPLFPVDAYDGSQPHANYDVSPDASSFVMVRRDIAMRLVVMQNLPELVRRRQGVARIGG
jgi:Tol biopolymer transport system component